MTSAFLSNYSSESIQLQLIGTMSQWESIRVRGLYNVVSQYYQYFPIEVRAVLAPWIEDHVLNSQVDPDNHEHIQYLYGFFNLMLEQLKAYIEKLVANDDQSIWFRQTLRSKYDLISRTYQNDPATIYRRLKDCLEQEQQLLMTMDLTVNAAQPQAPQLPSNSLQDLKARLHSFFPPKSEDVKRLLRMMATAIEELGNNYNEALRIQEMISAADLKQNGFQRKAELNQRLADITRFHQQRKQEFKDAMAQALNILNIELNEIKIIRNLYISELYIWKVEQRKSCNGFKKSKNLDDLDVLAKSIATVILDCNKQLIDAQQLQQNEASHTNSQFPAEVAQICQSLNKEIMDLMESLTILVVERQPHQVLRSKTTPMKSGIKLRLLAGDVLNRNATCVVDVILVNENEAKKQHADPSYSPRSTIKLLNNSKMMRFDADSNTFSADLTGIQLSEKIPRRSKKNSKGDETKENQQYVAEEKWYFFFSTQFNNVLGQNVPVRTISCPVSITCHPNQDAAAWGTILWHNAFANDPEQPFVVPRVVDCDELMDNLDKKFAAVTGRGFTERNKEMIRHKLLRSAPTQGTVSWELFFTEPLEGIKQMKNNKSTTVSFWEWLFAIMKLCEKTEDPHKSKENHHFQKYWEDGKIAGFSFRDETEYTLRQSNTKGEGVFTFRFSDTVLGSVTLLFVIDGKIQKYEPYTLEDLKYISLADRVLYKSHLRYLYRGTEMATPGFGNTDPWKMLKNDAFSESALSASKAELYKNGYLIWKVNELEVEMGSLMSRSRNYSTTSLCSSASYSEQSSTCTPSSSSALALSPSSISSSSSPGPQSQSHGSSGCQNVEFSPGADGPFADSSIYDQMQEAGFILHHEPMNEEDV